MRVGLKSFGRQVIYLSHTVSPYFALVIFEVESCCMLRSAWISILIFMHLSITGVTGMGHHTQPLVDMWSYEHFARANLELQST
jgi:hypothetical protein